MKDKVEVLAVTCVGVVRILGSLKVEELESMLDEIKNTGKLTRNEEPNDSLLTRIAESREPCLA